LAVQESLGNIHIGGFNGSLARKILRGNCSDMSGQVQ